MTHLTRMLNDSKSELEVLESLAEQAIPVDDYTDTVIYYRKELRTFYQGPHHMKTDEMPDFLALNI